MSLTGIANVAEITMLQSKSNIDKELEPERQGLKCTYRNSGTRMNQLWMLFALLIKANI